MQFFCELKESWINRPTYKTMKETPFWVVLTLTMLSALLMSMTAFVLSKTAFPYYQLLNSAGFSDFKITVSLILLGILLAWYGAVAVLSSLAFSAYSVELKRRMFD